MRDGDLFSSTVAAARVDDESWRLGDKLVCGVEHHDLTASYLRGLGCERRVRHHGHCETQRQREPFRFGELDLYRRVVRAGRVFGESVDREAACSGLSA